MRAILHLIATLVLAPYLLLAAAFVVLGGAIATGSLGGFLAALLAFALWLVPWGALGAIVALLVLLALGINERTRWLGALLVCMLASAAIVLIAWLDSGPLDAGAALFLAPCAAVALCGGWLARVEWRGAATR